MGVAAQWVHGAQVCVIPRPENNYQPLALHRRSLAALSLLLLLSKAAALSVLGLTPQTANLATITTAHILQLTNQERTSRGLPALVLNGRLSRAAQEKAQDLLERDYFAHISPQGVTPWFWMAKAGYSYRVAGENLAIDFLEAEEVVAAWIASPSHRDNLLHADYTETGVAALTGEFEGRTSTVVVHMFGTPAVAAATTGPAPTVSPAPATPAAPAPAVLLPTPTPAVPRAPHIALVGEPRVVQTAVVLTITAEPGVVVYVRAGEVVITSAGVPASGALTLEVPLEQVPDGELLISAYVRSASGVMSAPAEPVTVQKDTSGPQLRRDQLVALAGPATDRLQAALVSPVLGSERLLVRDADGTVYFDGTSAPTFLPFPLQQSLTAVAFDAVGNGTTVDGLTVAPAFVTEKPDFTAPPVRLRQFSRRLALAVGLTVTVLLAAAILIRIRVQHPRMVAHASLVILLAAVFFLV